VIYMSRRQNYIWWTSPEPTTQHLLLECTIPVDVILPGLVKMGWWEKARRSLELPVGGGDRRLDEAHVLHVLQKVPPFSVVATAAGGDDVGPVRHTAKTTRPHVVVRQLVCR
jgi:hypothetical protein